MYAFRIALLLLPFVASLRAAAGEAEDLIAQVNAYRSEAQTCDGAATAPVPPLVANATLAAVRVEPNRRLLDSLKAAGYPAASTQYITVSGPVATGDVMRFIAERYCKPLTSAQFNDIGVQRIGTNWQIVLARRLLSPDLGDSQQAGMEVLRLTNAARATARSCGNRRFEAALPVSWNAKLAAAALGHSRDMAARSYLAHVAADGSRPPDRATRAGYSWASVGENIAAGQGSAEQVVAGWLASPGHCVNVMDPKFTEMGTAYAINPKSDSTIYWTQVFGATR